MSHFTVLVATKTAEDLEAALAPFDENLEVERYREYTREELIALSRQNVREYETKGLYAEFQKDRWAYLQKLMERGPDRFPWDHLGYLIHEFPQRIKWTDEQHYAYLIEDYEDVDENGDVWSERNPNSYWDWWTLGGRWTGNLTLKEGAEGDKGAFSWGWSEEERKEVAENPLAVSQARKGDIDWDNTSATYALVINGEWIGKATMGFWGISLDEKFSEDEWPKRWREAVDTIDDDMIVSLVDCHI